MAEMNNVDSEMLYHLAEQVGTALKVHGLMLATAESCTGGWVGEVVTAIPGSSQWFERGFVTYTNVAKQEMLGVSPETLEQHGAVSEPTVREMVEGALRHSHAQIGVAISGIAGPGGATPSKPVGTVCLAWAMKDREVRSKTQHFAGNRQDVRRQAVVVALNGILELLATRQEVG